MFKFFGFIGTLTIIYIGVGLPYIYATFILGIVRNFTFYLPVLFVGWLAWKAYRSPLFGAISRRKS